MTFGPVTVVRPGASVVVAAMGPQGLQGTPGLNGTPGATGPSAWGPLTVWQSGQTYTPAPPASLVYINGSTYLCTALHTSGSFVNDLANGRWQIVASVGPQGAPGTPGSTWYSGSGLPSGAIGVNGDYFFRTDTYDVLIKVSGNWAAIANLRGVAGNTVNSGQGNPASTVGVNGDFYLDTQAYAMWGPKVNGSWPASGQSLIGPSGSGQGSVNGSGSTTQGNVAVWGANNTVLTDGGRLDYVVKDNPASPYQSVAKDSVWWVTTGGAKVQILPANPTAGMRVRAVRAGPNIVTVQGNGNTINGVLADLVINRNRVGFEFLWDSALSTWLLILLQHA